MKIAVCIKHVPDTEAKIKIAADGTSPDLAGVKMIISPYDEYALEEALLLKEAGAVQEVVVVGAGDDGAAASLRQALAMGADRAVHVQAPALAGADALGRASTLAAALRVENPDLVFTGKTGVGDDESQVGPMLGELLDRPQVGSVFKMTLAAGRFTAFRGIEGAVEVVEGSLPAVISWDKGEHEPRYASLKGIMAAKKKPLAVVAPEAPAKARHVVRESLTLPPPRPQGRLLPGSPQEAARDLARLLRDEAKVI
ncbi:MAG TPA: electron transfer flavoprotein subunit beta/FixA family protein [Candidatus Polarisedimenticolaceae bacterium]|nr:electron transfer flavoprotein subunit beta/FixA family protein [Candidatus Polarisedimenticolaceae bacterium]